MFRLDVAPVTFFSIFGFVVCDSNWEWLAFASGAWSNVETNEFDVGLNLDGVMLLSLLLPRLSFHLIGFYLYYYYSLFLSLFCVCLFVPHKFVECWANVLLLLFGKAPGLRAFLLLAPVNIKGTDGWPWTRVSSLVTSSLSLFF